VAALVKLGRMQGYPDGTLRPKASITREEFAQLMRRLVVRYITEPGEYTFEAAGAVVIRVPGVILKDCTIAGDLILGDDVVRENVTLENTVFVTPAGETTTAPRLVVRAEARIVEAGDSGAPPLAGPGDDEPPAAAPAPGGGGSTPPTYALDIRLTSSLQGVSTERAAGLPGGDRFYLVLRDHLRDNAAHLENQSGSWLGGSAGAGTLFTSLLSALVDDVSLDMLADMTALTQYLTVSPGSAVSADRWKDPSLRLSDAEGQSTLIFDDAPFHTEMLVDVGRDGAGYTLQLTISGGVSGLSVGSSWLTAQDSLYGNIFGSVERRLDALLRRYALAADLSAADYADRLEAWFYDTLGGEPVVTVAQGDILPLLNRNATIRDAGGYDFTLHGRGFTIDVSVR
jgi:hypothetical protein